MAQSTTQKPDLQRIFQVHNGARTAIGLAPLSWNPALARDAQAHAEQLARTGRLHHSGRDGRSGHGENLWAGTRDRYSADEMVGAWIDEKRFFRPGRFPDNSTTGNWATVAHYTQIVWRGTNEIGCGIASGQSMDYLVCRYARPGNIIGEHPY